jgi:hypothetical protein
VTFEIIGGGEYSPYRDRKSSEELTRIPGSSTQTFQEVVEVLSVVTVGG